MADALWSQVATVTNFANVGGSSLDGKGWTWNRRNGAALVSPGDLDLSNNLETGAKNTRSTDAGLLPLLAIGTGDFSLEIELQADGGDQPSFFSGLYCTTVWGLSLRNFGREIEFEGNSIDLDVRDGATVQIHLGRSGGQMYFHRNGVLLGSGFVPSNFGGAPTAIAIGAQPDDTNGFSGRILKSRITMGVCRYTANYTPVVGDFDTNGVGPAPEYTTATATPAAGAATVSGVGRTSVRSTGLAAGVATVSGRGFVYGEDGDLTEEELLLGTLMLMQIVAEEEGNSTLAVASPAAGTSTASGVGRTLGQTTAGATAAQGRSTTSAVGRSTAIAVATPIAGNSEARALTNAQGAAARATPAAGSSSVSATSGYFSTTRARTDGAATTGGVGGITGLITTTATPAAGSAFVKGVGKGSPGSRGGDDGPGRPPKHPKPPKPPRGGVARRLDNRNRGLVDADLEETLRPGIKAERERLERERELANRPPEPPKPDKTALAKQAALNNLRLLELEAQRQAVMAEQRAQEAARVAQEQAAQHAAIVAQRKQLALLLMLMAEG